MESILVNLSGVFAEEGWESGAPLSKPGRPGGETGSFRAGGPSGETGSVRVGGPSDETGSVRAGGPSGETGSVRAGGPSDETGPGAPDGQDLSGLENGKVLPVVLDFSGLEGTAGYCDAQAAEHILTAFRTLPTPSLCWIDTGDYHHLSALRLEAILGTDTLAGDACAPDEVPQSGQEATDSPAPEQMPGDPAPEQMPGDPAPGRSLSGTATDSPAPEQMPDDPAPGRSLSGTATDSPAPNNSLSKPEPDAPVSGCALVLLDHHNDRQTPAFGADLLSCGGWVAYAAGHCPALQQVITIGAAGPDMAGVTDFPNGCTPEQLLATLRPGIPVFISVDLDVLSTQWFRADWDQGDMTLPTLLELLRTLLSSSHPLLGIDICGGITRAKGATDSDLARNLRCRQALQGLLA